MIINSSSVKAKNYYTYSASGVKLKTEQRYDPNYTVTPSNATNPTNDGLADYKNTDYVGNIVYETVKSGSTITNKTRILVDGGYIEGGVYYYYLTDHLGNNRVVVNSSGAVIQRNHYYPFGMSFADTPLAEQGKQPYKYNGKELDGMHQLNMYDYSARFYESALGRFSTVDPLAEIDYNWNPYVYCGNNPIKRIDPTGMIYDDYFNQQGKYLGTDNDLNSDKVRVMDNTTWEANRSGDGTINHDTGVVNSSLHSESGITEKASLAIYEHYNETGVKLRAESGDYLMEYNVTSVKFTNEILSEKLFVNMSRMKGSKVSDNISDIRNSLVHEGKHKSDVRVFGAAKYSKMPKDILENRAISTQVNHSTWKKTTPYFKSEIEKYANQKNIIVPKANYSPLQPQKSVPLQIKRLK